MMKHTWTQQTAMAALKGNVEIKERVIIVRGGLSGLTACGAVDYLKNHCGYTLLFQPAAER